MILYTENIMNIRHIYILVALYLFNSEIHFKMLHAAIFCQICDVKISLSKDGQDLNGNFGIEGTFNN